MRAFIVMCLLVLASSLGASSSSFQTEPSVRVLRGHATLVNAQGLHRLSKQTPEKSILAGAHAELGLYDEVRVRWPRRMSITVRGYSSFSVEPAGVASAHPHTQFLFLGNADVELRRGHLIVDLPQGWRLDLERCSFHIKERVDGQIELVHRAGKPARIIDLSGQKRRVPSRLSAGGNLFLPLLAEG